MGISKIFLIICLLWGNLAVSSCPDLMALLGKDRVLSLIEAQNYAYKVTVLTGVVDQRPRTIVVLGQTRIKNILAARIGDVIYDQYDFRGEGALQVNTFQEWLNTMFEKMDAFYDRVFDHKKFRKDQVAVTLSRKDLLEGVSRQLGQLRHQGNLTEGELDETTVDLGYEILTFKEITEELRQLKSVRRLNLEEGRSLWKGIYPYFFKRHENMAGNVESGFTSNPDKDIMLVLVGKRFARQLSEVLTTQFNFSEVPLVKQ